MSLVLCMLAAGSYVPASIAAPPAGAETGEHPHVAVMPMVARDAVIALGAHFTITHVEAPEPNRARVDATYVIAGPDGLWSARVNYLQWCRDARGVTIGTSDGQGGLISQNGGALNYPAGSTTFDFSASIVSDDPNLQFPVECTHVIIWYSHTNSVGQIDIGANTAPLPAPTVWQAGVYIVHCGGECVGW